MPRHDGSRTRKRNRNTWARRSGKHNKQTKPRRSQDRTYPWQPWPAEPEAADVASAARRAVEHADALTERFAGRK